MGSINKGSGKVYHGGSGYNSGGFSVKGSSGVDEKSKVSVNDTTTDYLNNKLLAGDGILLAIQNPGANEQLRITNDQYNYEYFTLLYGNAEDSFAPDDGIEPTVGGEGSWLNNFSGYQQRSSYIVLNVEFCVYRYRCLIDAAVEYEIYYQDAEGLVLNPNAGGTTVTDFGIAGVPATGAVDKYYLGGGETGPWTVPAGKVLCAYFKSWTDMLFTEGVTLSVHCVRIPE